jgi:regulator of replication initiation timing
MTDSILLKLEEKIVSLLTEVENMRKELTQIKQENVALKGAQVDYAKKLQGLISLMDTLEPAPVMHHYEHEREEFATA